MPRISNIRATSPRTGMRLAADRHASRSTPHVDHHRHRRRGSRGGPPGRARRRRALREPRSSRTWASTAAASTDIELNLIRGGYVLRNLEIVKPDATARDAAVRHDSGHGPRAAVARAVQGPGRRRGRHARAAAQSRAVGGQRREAARHRRQLAPGDPRPLSVSAERRRSARRPRDVQRARHQHQRLVDGARASTCSS